MIKKINMVLLSVVALAINSVAFSAVPHFYLKVMNDRAKEITMNFNVIKGDVALNNVLPATLAANTASSEKYGVVINADGKNSETRVVFNQGQADECTFTFKYHPMLEIDHQNFCTYGMDSADTIVLIAKKPLVQ